MEQEEVGGQRAHVPTAQFRQQVIIATAGGLSAKDTARLIGATRTELRRHYAGEMKAARAIMQVNAIAALVKAPERGSMSAIKALLLRFDPTWATALQPLGAAAADDGAERLPSLLLKVVEGAVEQPKLPGLDGASDLPAAPVVINGEVE